MGCLRGACIVFGNTGAHNLQDLTGAASALGAAVFSPHDALRATYLITNSVLPLTDGTDPYLTSIQANPNLVIVSTDWLSACHAEQRQVPTGQYVHGPFSGIRASITNFGAKDRDMVVLQLKQGGANYSPELFRHTTHLVGNRPGGNKHKHAREWGLFIVHHDWVLECLRAGHRVDERPYNLDTYAPKDTSVGPLASGGEYQRPASRTVSTARGVSCFSGGGDGAGATGASVPVRQATASIRGVVAPGPTESVSGAPGVNSSAALARGSGSAAALRPANGLGPSSAAGGEDPGAAAAKGYPARGGGAPALGLSGQQQPQPADQFYHIPAVPPDDCYFLHWVRLWMVGCTASEQGHVLKAVRESGATREPALHAGVTHIVCGSVLSVADLAELRLHMAEHREQVRLARLAWLYECVNRRAYLEPEGHLAMNPAQLLAQGSGLVGTGQLVPAQSGRLGQRSREDSPALGVGGAMAGAALAGAGGVGSGSAVVAGRLGVAPLDDYVPLDPEANNRTMDSISVRNAAGGVFSGLWFTLVAVAGTEEEHVATKLVRQGGGMIMSASTEKSVRDANRRYAVCPLSLPQSAVDRICSTRGRERAQSEFERVPAEQRVTVAWLRACVSLGQLLPVKRETPLFRPLPHALPLPRFQGLVLAVSQYHVEQREVLEQLITGLGGTYTEKLNKRCHFLVIPDAHGDKFAAALKWGIPCVRADWVLESAYAGRPLDDQLIAFLPAGITPAEMEEKRAAASRARGAGGPSQMGPSQMGPSQMGPTQRPLPLQVSQLPATLPVRGHQATTQCYADSRPIPAPSGLPPRPSAVAPDRHGAPTHALPGAPAAAQRMPVANPLPMAPPPAPPAGASREASTAAGPPSSAAAATRAPSVLKPILSALLADDEGETDEAVIGAPCTRGAAEVSQGALSGNLAAGVRPGAAACRPQAPSGRASSPGTDVGANTTSGGGASANRGGGPQPPAKPDPPQPLTEPEAPVEPQEQQQADARDLTGAAAMLMQFLDNNRSAVPEMAFSQLDLPVQLPIPAPGASEGPLNGAGASSMSSREPGSSVLSLKTTDGDGGVGGGISGRRSRKRAAAASVGEAQGATGKVGGLPGRRTRNDDEEEGFAAASQQVGYEAVAAAPPPRATRSSTRGARGAGGADAKESLIKAVQGNLQ